MTCVHLRPGLARNDLARKISLTPNRPPTWPESTARKAGAPVPRRPALAACITVAAPGFAVILWRRARCRRPLGAAARFNSVVAAGNPPAAQPAPSTFQLAAAEAVPPQAAPAHTTAGDDPGSGRTPQDAAPAAPAALPDQTQLLQTMARDLANLERNIEQLKTNQQQMASDNSKAIEELKASQEEMKRVLAKVSEQSPPRASQPADAACSDLAQARTAAAASESAAAISIGNGCTTIGSRRAVIIEIRFGDNRSRAS